MNEGQGRSYWMILRNDRKLEIEKGSTISHCVENWLWKRLRTCRKTDLGMTKSINLSKCIVNRHTNSRKA